jgi:predicted dehydrogenase/GT2 family glycosyltransferase
MNTNSHKVSIVMLTRNRAAFTIRCLNSLANPDVPVEWIIVDNGSSDETRTYLEEWSTRSTAPVKIIWNSKNIGSCGARNQGLAAASGDLVLFLDNDVMFASTGWLGNLIKPIAESPTIVATTPLLLFPGASGLIQCAGGGVTSSGRVGLIGRTQNDGIEWVRNTEIAWATTAALLVTRTALLRAGGFDESFDPVAICEDIDLCCRLRAAGGRILFAGSSRLVHFEGITFNHLGYDKRSYWLRHMRVIRNRWFDVLTSGPVHSNEELRWHPVIKDYSNLDEPIVRLPTRDDNHHGNAADFFSSFLDPIGDGRPDLRIAVIGCGQVAQKGALPGFSPPGSDLTKKAAPFLDFNGSPNVTVTAVCDVVENRAMETAGQWGVRRVETCAERLFDRIPIEAACICSPPSVHASQIIAALKRGIPVLVEKPPVVNEQELADVLSVQAQQGRLPVMVNLPWMFHPAVAVARDIIASGSLGAVNCVKAVFEHNGPENWAPDASWYRTGGIETLILDLALHVTSLSERLLGAPVSFDSAVNSATNSERAQARFLIGDIEAWFTVGWDGPKPRFCFEAHGSKASLFLNLIPWRSPEQPGSIRVTRCDDARWIMHDDAPLLGGPYRHFVESLRLGQTPVTDLTAVANALTAVLHWTANTGKTG